MADLLAPLERALRELVRVGRISSVDEKRHTAQVEFASGEVSYDLQILVTRPGDYSLPVKDTPVVCLLLPGAQGDGFVLGAIYTEADAAPEAGAGARVIAGDDIRLGSKDASDAVALAPATKDEIQKVLDYAQGIATAIQGGVATPGNDGGAGLKSTIVAALPDAPTIDEPGAEHVVAE